jgi:hypothetical protein
MWPLLLLGGAAALYFYSKSSSSSSSAVTSAQQSAQYQAGFASANAQAFNSQAQALGLSQADAQNAANLGLTPQEYVDGGLTGTG